MKSHPVNLREKGSSPTVRTIIQILFLLATFLIGLRHLMPGESSKGGAFDAFCPFGGIETLWLYLTTGQTMATTNLLNFSVLLGVIGVSLLAGRAFCGWMCPVGTVQDLLAGLTRRLTGEKKTHPWKKEQIQVSRTTPSKIRSLAPVFKIFDSGCYSFSKHLVYLPSAA